PFPSTGGGATVTAAVVAPSPSTPLHPLPPHQFLPFPNPIPPHKEADLKAIEQHILHLLKGPSPQSVEQQQQPPLTPATTDTQQQQTHKVHWKKKEVAQELPPPLSPPLNT